MVTSAWFSMLTSGSQWLLVVLNVTSGSQWLPAVLSGSQWLPVVLNGY